MSETLNNNKSKFRSQCADVYNFFSNSRSPPSCPQGGEPDPLRSRDAHPQRVVHQLQPDGGQGAGHLHCPLWPGVHMPGQSSAFQIKIFFLIYIYIESNAPVNIFS